MSYVIPDTALFLQDGKKVDVFWVRDLPTEDKPREKLRKYGVGALSIQELLMVLIGRGTSKEGVLEMSERIVREYGENILASTRSALVLAEELEIPETKAMQIAACAEIGRRLFQKKSTDLPTIRHPEDVVAYVAGMRNLPKEHLRGIYLGARHNVIHDEVLSIGTLDTSIVHPREVFRPAIAYAAAALILVHNHPSGDTKPSREDMNVTKQIQEVGELMGIQLLDHIIVTSNDYHSIIGT